MSSEAVYTISIELLDIEQALSVRKRKGVRTRPYQIHDPQHLDTPTGLPADLDQEARRSAAPPSTSLQSLFEGWSSPSPSAQPTRDDPTPQEPLNPQATAFEPAPLHYYGPRNKFSTTIKPPFEPFRRLDWRFGRIYVDMQDPESSSSAQAPTEAVDVGFGIVRLRRQPLSPESVHQRHQQQQESRSPQLFPEAGQAGDGRTLAILALPPIMTISDFLKFVAGAEEMVSHIRILRDEGASRSLALMRFRSAAEAELFRNEFNAKPFWAMTPDEVCHVVQVASIEVSNSSTVPFTFPTGDISNAPTSVGSASVAPELPSCVVCLERLDANITGLITIPCQHTFHCSCLSKWASGKCPVCRYTQTFAKAKNAQRPQEEDEFNRTACDQCGGSEKLWMCLLCGHVGGGRYACRHAVSHFEQSGHLYAMELETQRVWDYAGDAYVHRLIQNQSDGKLVELPSVGSSQVDEGKGREGPDSQAAEAQGKTERMAQEFSNLLVSQLESQRNYFLEKMSDLKQELFAIMDHEEHLRLSSEVQDNRLAKSRAEVGLKEAENTALAGRLDRLEQEVVPQLRRERERVEKRLDKANDTIRTLQKDFASEQSLTKGLHDRLRESHERLRGAQEEKQQLEKQVTEISQRLKDSETFAQELMHSLDFRARAANDGDLQGASMYVHDLSRPSAHERRRRELAENAAASSAAAAKSKKKKKPKKPPPSMHVAADSQTASTGPSNETAPFAASEPFVTPVEEEEEA